jgi:putative MATE family efflux protein
MFFSRMSGKQNLDRNKANPPINAPSENEPKPSGQFPGRKGPAIDLTQGSIPLNLLKLSWPMIVGSGLNMLGPTIDVMWVGKLGSSAVAGVGVAGIVIMVIMSAMMGLVTGMRALIARNIGADNVRDAVNVATQSIVVSGIIAVVIAAAGFFLATPLLSLMGLEAEVVDEGAAYLRMVFISAIPMMLRFMCEGSMQSAGDSFRPMTITIVYRAIHIALCPFFIFGWWIFPQMGVTGAAFTNIISQSIGLAISVWILTTHRTKIHLTFKGFRIDWNTIWRILKIGIPSSIMGVQMSLGNFILIKLISPFGTSAVAAHTIWQRVDMLLMMTVMGLGMGGGILAGQNLGAGKPERAVKSGWTAALMGQGFLILCAVLIFFGAEIVVRLFNSEPALVETASSFLRIAASSYLVVAFLYVFQYCISGSGDTLPPMIFGIVGTWLIQLPLAYFLPKLTGWGIYGIRWAMAITAVLMTIGFTLYFISGRWKRKVV